MKAVLDADIVRDFDDDGNAAILTLKLRPPFVEVDKIWREDASILEDNNGGILLENKGVCILTSSAFRWRQRDQEDKEKQEMKRKLLVKMNQLSRKEIDDDKVILLCKSMRCRYP